MLYLATPKKYLLQVNDLGNEMTTNLMEPGTMNVVSFEHHNSTMFIGKRALEKQIIVFGF